MGKCLLIRTSYFEEIEAKLSDWYTICYVLWQEHAQCCNYIENNIEGVNPTLVEEQTKVTVSGKDDIKVWVRRKSGSIIILLTFLVNL